MENNIRAGMRVLYKQGNSNWMTGTIIAGNAEVNEFGVWIQVLPKGATPEEEIHHIEINQLFTDCKILDDWMKDTLLSKEEYFKIIKGEDFHKSTEVAWFSDGEYYYYPVSKYNEIWINKQPFDYILRNT